MVFRSMADHRAFLPEFSPFGPNVTAAALLAVAVSPVLVIAWLVPPMLVMPVLSIVSLIGAGSMGLFAWRFGSPGNRGQITSWDVAGMLLFIGFAAGMLSKIDPVVQFFGNMAVR